MTAPSATELTDDWRSMRDRNDGRVPNIASFLPFDADHLATIIGDILDRDDLSMRRDLERLQQHLRVRGVTGITVLERLHADYPKMSWGSSGDSIFGWCDDYSTRDETFAHVCQGLGLAVDEDSLHPKAAGTVEGIDVWVRR
ncbi:hypothetical protein ACFWPK_04170 [Nocardia sp. NPDC058519]|uniref:hypothetical protein n=1 Tax=Nocardia sp. NPDC058519 TaxID=3346535 RepID=UPI00365DAF30